MQCVSPFWASLGTSARLSRSLLAAASSPPASGFMACSCLSQLIEKARLTNTSQQRHSCLFLESKELLVGLGLVLHGFRCRELVLSELLLQTGYKRGRALIRGFSLYEGMGCAECFKPSGRAVAFAGGSSSADATRLEETANAQLRKNRRTSGRVDECILRAE